MVFYPTLGSEARCYVGSESVALEVGGEGAMAFW
ncbi:unnamed protein product [Tuber melanosporum]|uniref:(Perigord truffle) hypothetical protein n=1 Tax=Tuber melanosporum (strain Mel28) TaxID=656061 RepID=D5GPV5_TUBMM|nr:uncharacterized protein GSTUM_00012067001 [Tuber melanosporum]CAZ86557.1 unnamed protein product [Tuber melanosporum]